MENSSSTCSVDACACPLCGQPNQCAMTQAQSTNPSESTCWCVHATFSAELLAQVPPHAQRKACICRACTEKSM